MEMDMDMSEEQFYAIIGTKKAGKQLEHPDQALAFTLTVRTPQCGHAVWGKKLARKMSQLQEKRIKVIKNCVWSSPENQWEARLRKARSIHIHIKGRNMPESVRNGLGHSEHGVVGV
jgi:hypothetical protein